MLVPKWQDLMSACMQGLSFRESHSWGSFAILRSRSHGQMLRPEQRPWVCSPSRAPSPRPPSGDRPFGGSSPGEPQMLQHSHRYTA